MNRYIVAKYIRLSLEDEKTDSLSISNQRALIDRYIDALEIDGAETLEFIDNGHSGTNFERPAVQELLGLVRESKIDCIIVKDFSRFGRNALETGYFIERVFPLFHTRFISVADGFDSAEHEGDTGGLEVSFKFLMHEYYSHDLSRKEKSAKYIKFKRGEYQSAICPYGYRKGENGRMEIDPEAAAVVRLIFESALSMKNAQDIVKILYEKQIPTPGEYKKANGKAFHDVSRSIGIWQRTTVLRILADERYAGTYIMGKRAVTEIGGQRVRMKDESEWFKIPDHHPAIVSRELYDQVQAKLLHFKCPKQNREYVLRGKMFCGCCRHALARAPRKTPAFLCRYTKVDDTAGCNGLEIGEQAMEDLLFEIISKQARAILDIDLPNTGDLKLQSVKLAEYDRLITQHQDNKRGLYEQFIQGGIDAEAYRSRKASVDAGLTHLIRLRDAIMSKKETMLSENSAGANLRRTAETVIEESRLTRTLVDLLIDKVYVYPENRIEIEWKVAGFAETAPNSDLCDIAV